MCPDTCAGSLSVLDITAPTSPVRIGRLSGAFGGRLTVRAGAAYGIGYLDDVSHLTIVDVTLPSAPIEVGRVPVDDAVDGAVRDDLAFVITEEGLDVVDAGDPSAPRLVAEVTRETTRGTPGGDYD